MRKTIASLLLLIILTSCTNLNSTYRTSPTIVMETALAEARTSIVETVTLIPSVTPTSRPLPSLTPLPPTLTPTQTSTSVPELISHKWNPSQTLIIFDNFGGDGGSRFRMYLPPRLSLLWNGELFFTTWDNKNNLYLVQSTILTPEGVCHLLNSIDQIGFFDYDPSTYISDPQNWHPPVMGAQSTYISIKAWRSKSVSLYGLDDFINELDFIKEAWKCGDCPDLEIPTILPSLRNTYQLLDNYQPENVEIYTSNRLGVWVSSYADTSSKPIVWPINSIKLSSIVPSEYRTNNSPDIILTGTKAKTLYGLFNKTINPNGLSFSEGEQKYQVFVRPLLPNEYLPSPVIPTATLSCSPSDGWNTIP